MKDKIDILLKKLKSKIDVTKKNFNSIEMIAVMIMAVLFGIFLNQVFITSASDNFVATKNSLEEIEKVYKTLLSDAYKDLTKKELEEAAIEGMMGLLGDKYSYYMDEAETKDFEERLKGSYSGFGVSISSKENQVRIEEVFDNSPAAIAGLKPGDVFLKLNDEDISAKDVSEISAKIKGQSGKTIKILIKRDDQELSFSVTTGKVDIPSATSEIFTENNKKIGYINLSIFAENSDKQFAEELNKLKKENITSLIIDVRGNSGGYLTTVTKILQMFLNEKQVMYQISTKGEIKKYCGDKKANITLPIALLIDSNSASASEVMAAALNEEYGATLIGTKTYGKGSVQKTLTLDNGTMIKYTAETWLTSKGNSIDEKGIDPTLEVIFDGMNYKGDSQTDNQLQAALKEMSK